MSFPVLKSQTQHQTQDFLSAHADALVAGTLDLDRLLEQYDQVNLDQVRGLLDLAEQLSQILTDVAPSDLFLNQLRRQLLEAGRLPRITWWEWVRHLPPRTQWAAGIGGATLTAGVVLLAWGPLVNLIEFWRNRWTATA